MPTKSELETELAALRAEMDELRKARAQRMDQSEINEEQTQPDAERGDDGEPNASKKIKEDLEQSIRDIASELEAVAEKNPKIALIGVFVAGLIIGRLFAR